VLVVVGVEVLDHYHYHDHEMLVARRSSCSGSVRSRGGVHQRWAAGTCRPVPRATHSKPFTA